MCDSALIAQALATLRGLGEQMRCASGRADGAVQAPAVQSWADSVETAIADLLEIERRARYGEVLAVCLALVDAAVDGRAASPAVIRAEGCASVLAPSQ